MGIVDHDDGVDSQGEERMSGQLSPRSLEALNQIAMAGVHGIWMFQGGDIFVGDGHAYITPDGQCDDVDGFLTYAHRQMFKQEED